MRDTHLHERGFGQGLLWARGSTAPCHETAAETQPCSCEHGSRRDGAFHDGGVGSTTRAIFEAYVERVLTPSLRPGQVVVMDNLGAHRGDGKSKARSRGALVEATGRALSAITSRTQRATSDTAATRSTLDRHENRCQHSPSRLSAPRKPTVLAIAPSQPKHGLRSRRIFRR